jgi:hypothetical protein
VTLFQILTETPQMTATEVIERTNEKGILLAPTSAGSSPNISGPMIDRELDLLAGLARACCRRCRRGCGGARRVRGGLHLAAGARRAGAGGGRVLSHRRIRARARQRDRDPSLLDPLDFDTAIPEIAEIKRCRCAGRRMTMHGCRQAQGPRPAARQEQIQAAPAAGRHDQGARGRGQGGRHASTKR